MAVDEPDMLDPNDKPIMLNEDDNESTGFKSSLEIFDSGSDTDICEESELSKFSKMLFDAQKKALAEEKARGKKQKSYTGHSRATMYHQKHHQKYLATQGILPISMYMPQKKCAEELTAPQDLTFKELEDSSDIEEHIQDLTFKESEDSSDVEEPPRGMQSSIASEQCCRAV